MIQIFSKVDGRLLHQIQRLNDIKNGRKDLSDPKEFLQMSTLKLKKDTTFKPHKHIWHDIKPTAIAQESWVVIKGSVRCIFYDLDDTIIDEIILNPGDCSITYFGGHNYYIEEDCIVLEIKTGPYFGVELDKKHIE